MPDYADKAHPPLGICVMILVILNVMNICYMFFTESDTFPEIRNPTDT